MANYYYEISGPMVRQWGGKYHVVQARKGDALMAAGFSITSESDRIWKEDDNGCVTFIKNRWDDDCFNVDMKEFMWVKLSSRVHRGRS